MTSPELQAADPSTPGAVLQQIAADHPDLRVVIAANPSTYPALLEWLGALGDPAVDEVLQSRVSTPSAEEFVHDDNEATAVQEVVSEELQSEIVQSDVTAEGTTDTHEEAVTFDATEEEKSSDERLAVDPATPPAVLQDLAARRKDLHSQILAHPSTYPALREWILAQSPGQELLQDTVQISAIENTAVAMPAYSHVTEPPQPQPASFEQSPWGALENSAPSGSSSSSNAGLWIAFSVLGVLAVVSVGVALWLLFQ